MGRAIVTLSTLQKSSEFSNVDAEFNSSSTFRSSEPLSSPSEFSANISKLTFEYDLFKHRQKVRNKAGREKRESHGGRKPIPMVFCITIFIFYLSYSFVFTSIIAASICRYFGGSQGNRC